MKPRSCVLPTGDFIFGVHRPFFTADNFRENDFFEILGRFPDGRIRENGANFPTGNVEEPEADIIYEIPNPFPFRGTTYIANRWASEKAGKPDLIGLPAPQGMSFSNSVNKWFSEGNLPPEKMRGIFESLPEPVLLAIASTSTDPADLTTVANICCEFIFDDDGESPVGLKYRRDENGAPKPAIKNKDVFETVANNHFLPDEYKNAMVLKPGVQGESEIVGEFFEAETHIFEYLRRNSYIPWGHYAANMAHDSVRYRLIDLSMKDMAGLRHLYYQRTYTRMARQIGIPVSENRKTLSKDRLEALRQKISSRVKDDKGFYETSFDCTLWGWNFGFDFSPTKYRLHASHQQIHQQFALIPSSIESPNSEIPFLPFAAGDMIAEFINDYYEKTGKNFFECYIQAIRSNRRMDEVNADSSLIIYEDKYVMVFVPKAQTSQWEIQLMTLPRVGNVFEAATPVRDSLDKAILISMKILWKLGARMVTTIEYPKRLSERSSDQRLLYAFLPKIPHSPGAFSEAQLRWINGCFPEDFASACRAQLQILRNSNGALFPQDSL